MIVIRAHMGIHQVQTPVSIINMIRMFINNAGTHFFFQSLLKNDHTIIETMAVYFNL